MTVSPAKAADTDGRAPAGAVRLTPELVEKVWGRVDFGLWGPPLSPDGSRVGEIIYRLPGNEPAELLVKTLFTAERLSVQVHPTGDAAREMGLKHGKDEAWVVLAAEPGATIGLGLKTPMSAEALRAAVASGEIEDHVDWRPVAAGDVLFAPAGTIHAIGGGIMLFEIQQNIELTYRLYDYGRPRELHVEAALAVADCAPLQTKCRPRMLAPGRNLLVEGPSFVLERVNLDGSATLRPEAGRPVWIAVTDGNGRVDDSQLECGDVWLATGACLLAGRADLLLAYPGAAVMPGAWDHA